MPRQKVLFMMAAPCRERVRMSGGRAPHAVLSLRRGALPPPPPTTNLQRCERNGNRLLRLLLCVVVGGDELRGVGRLSMSCVVACGG